MANEFVARNGLIIKTLETGSTETKMLVQDDDGRVKMRPLSSFGLDSGISDVTYAQFITLVSENSLIPGTQYRITDFATVHWLAEPENYFYDVPPPGNVSIVPDDVGDNPITYYYRVVYASGGENPYRSLFTTENTYTEGDSTTETIFNCDEFPDWVDGVAVIRGTVSGTYTEEVIRGTVSGTYTEEWENGINSGNTYDDFDFVEGIYDTILQIPLYPNKVVNTGETESIIVTAASNNGINPEALSGLYGDIVYYFWDIEDFVSDRWYYDQDTSTAVPGFKGVIKRRIDTYNNIDMPYDWRNDKYVLWSIDQPNWRAQTYNQNSVVKYNDVLYVANDNIQIRTQVDIIELNCSEYPSPSNIEDINISVNAVGNNPVTYYYMMCYLSADEETRSEFCGESQYTEGDDTTETLLTCAPIPGWANSLIIFRGVQSGTYTGVTSTSFVSGFNMYDQFVLEDGSLEGITNTKTSYGTATITAGNIFNGQIEFNVDLATTAANFVNNNSYYFKDEEGITLTISNGDTPAPGNISITPDDVGGNPITYYYRVGFGFGDPFVWRTEISDEYTYQEGDDTSETIFSCDALPSWATYAVVFRGTSSGKYGEIWSGSISSDIYDNFFSCAGNYTYEDYLWTPIFQQPSNNQIIFTAADAGTSFTSPTIRNSLGYLGGSVYNFVRNYSVNTTPDESDKWTSTRIDLDDISSYICYYSGGYYFPIMDSTIPIYDLNNYEIVNVFQSGLDDCYNIIFDESFYHPYITYGQVCNNMSYGTNCSHMIYTYSCSYMTYGNGCSDMTYGSNCYNMIYGTNCNNMFYAGNSSNMTYGSSCAGMFYSFGCYFMTYGSTCNGMSYDRDCYDMTYDSDCYYMFYGYECEAMSYGSGCRDMYYGYRCSNMTYGSGCNNMTYGSGCNDMTYGSGCGSITYDHDCGLMTYGSGCHDMTYGPNCGGGGEGNGMSFGSNCFSITFGLNCGSMTFGSYCCNMSYDSYCYDMAYDSHCYNMTYGSNCGNMTYGSNCGDMSYGYSCGNMTYGSSCSDIVYGTNCNSMTYGSSCESIMYGDYCSCLTYGSCCYGLYHNSNTSDLTYGSSNALLAGGVTDVTYQELITSITGNTLVPGAQYRITDYKTVHWMVDSDNSYIYNPSPAPTGIVITPDAVGDNSRSYFYVAFYCSLGNGATRSVATDEIEVVVGNSTTEIIIEGDALPEWANALLVFKGTESGVYTRERPAEIGTDIMSGWSEDISYNEVLANMSYHFETNKIINTGATESLLVTATSGNTISREAYSVLYPEDVIYYEWDINKFSGDRWYWDDSNGTARVPGFKGVITRRNDTLNRIDMPYDWRNDRYRLWSIDQPYWQSQEYNQGDFVNYEDILYVANDNIENVAQVETITLSCPNSPAPGNITIVPNAVGDNPVTYYYRICYTYENNGASFVSEFSEEGTYTEGADTTGTTFNCDALPAWANRVYIFRGTETSVYTEFFIGSYVSDVDIFGNFSLDDGGFITYIDSLPATFGTATITVGNSFSETAEFYTDLAITAADFVNSNAYYLKDEEGIILTTSGDDAPAPENISIIPDAVGSNPITYYYQVGYVYCEYEGPFVLSTHLSDENTYQEGDSTTETSFVCDALPEWANFAVIFRGTLSGEYNEMWSGSPESNIYNEFFLCSDNYTYYGYMFAPIHKELGDDRVIFTANNAGQGFTAPTITNIDGNLTGVVEHTTPNRNDIVENPLSSDKWTTTHINVAEGMDYICYNPYGYYCQAMGDNIPIFDLNDYIDVVAFSDGMGYNIVFEESIYHPYVTYGSNCYTMTYGSGCRNMTYGSGCWGMTFGSGCSDMIYGDNCSCMTYGSCCESMTFGSGCFGMTFDSSCFGMTFGSGCFGMTFGSYCGVLSFDAGSYNVTYGSMNCLISCGGGSGGVTDVTYSELITLITGNSLTAGAQYRITDYKTVHWMVDSDGYYVNSIAPAPTNITLTPDDVGNNPYIIYIKVFYDDQCLDSISLGSEEIEVIVGDDTTSIIIGCDPYPDWATCISVWAGEKSGNYQYYRVTYRGSDIYDMNISPVPYLYWLAHNPPHYLSDKVIVTGNTEPLLVMAISGNTISQDAYSATYPNDKITYEPLIANWTGLTAFYDPEAQEVVSGFTGIITYREDSVKNIKSPLDWRTIKYRLYSIDQVPWEPIEYESWEYVNYDGDLYVSTDVIINIAQVETVTLTGTTPTRQVETVTLSGTSGTANITGPGGLTCEISFAEGGTQDLTQTAADFVDLWYGDYYNNNIILSSDGEDIIFTSLFVGSGFTAPDVTNTSGNLSGTVDHTTPYVRAGYATVSETGGIESQLTNKKNAPGPENITITPDAVGDNPVTYHYRAAYYKLLNLSEESVSISVISSTDGTYEEGDSTTETIFSCDEIPEWATGVVVFRGTSNYNYTGATWQSGLPVNVYNNFFDSDPYWVYRVWSLSISLEDTAANFVSEYYSAYLEQDVVVTSNGADIIFTSDTAGNGFASPVITNTNGDLNGTVVHTTPNYNVETITPYDSIRWRRININAFNKYLSYDPEEFYLESIPIVFPGDYIDVNVFGEDCSNIDVADSTIKMNFITFGSYCYSMTFGSSCYSMTFGSSCYSMTFDSSCESMTFGSICDSMTFDSSCYSMTFDSNCDRMTFGSNCGGMTFGSYCYSMTFGSSCYIMTFGSQCGSDGDEWRGITFGSGCGSMTFGSGCYGITFGTYCHDLTFAAGTYNLTYGSMNFLITPAGMGGITDVTYSELVTLITGNSLSAGAQYRITDYKTVHWMVESDYDGGMDYVYAIAPAPTGIVITPNAVGNNPYIIYIKVFYDDQCLDSISLGSEEIEVIVGESTTSIIIDCDDYPDWASCLSVWMGESSGDYASYTVTLRGYDVYNLSESPFSYPEWLSNNPPHLSDKVIVTGNTEPLLVMAISGNTISQDAYSATYPNDKITYEPLIANWVVGVTGGLDTGLTAFYDPEAQEVVSGFTGIITYREDSVKNIKAPLDWRVFKYRLYSIDQEPWSGTTYDENSFVNFDDELYVSNSEIINTAQVEAITLTGITPQHQVETVTLIGTGGVAYIAGPGELIKPVTLDGGEITTLTEAASAFTMNYFYDYFAKGIIVSYSDDNIYFTSRYLGEGFIAPLITTVDSDLTGIVKHTTSNIVIGEAEIITGESPAPRDITIVPDDVGNNPSSSYYKAFYINTGSRGTSGTSGTSGSSGSSGTSGSSGSSGTSGSSGSSGTSGSSGAARSLGTDEIGITIGESTGSIIIDGSDMPSWSECLLVWSGSSSDYYPVYFFCSIGDDIMNKAVRDQLGTYEEFLSNVPIYHKEAPILNGIPAPPPGNITVTPDDVGNNPITYYCRAIYAFSEGVYRSKFSDEFTYTEGDSTTETIFNCDPIPSWADWIGIIRGTSSGIYTGSTYCENIPIDIYDEFVSSEDPYSKYFDIPTYLVPATLEETATNFVYEYYEDYLYENIVLSSEGGTLVFTSTIPGTEFTAPVITNVAGNLSGIVENSVPNYSVDTAPPGSTLWTKIYVEIDYLSYSSSNFYLNSMPIVYPFDYIDVNVFNGSCYDIDIADFTGKVNHIVMFSCSRITFGPGCGSMIFWDGCNNMSFDSGCANMTYNENCYNMSYGSGCYNMTYGTNCYDMSYSYVCGVMTYGPNCNNMTYGPNCNNMTYDYNCGGMTYGSGCNGMVYSYNCYNMTYGSGCGSMIYGSYCERMTYGSSCADMTYDSECSGMNYDSGCSNMSYGSDCGNMTYGSGCSIMNYGPGCQRMTYGSECQQMTYGSDCGNMTYGSGCGNMNYGNSCGYMDYGSGCAEMSYGNNISGKSYGSNNVEHLCWVPVPVSPVSAGQTNQVAKGGDYFYYYDDNTEIWRRTVSSIDWSNAFVLRFDHIYNADLLVGDVRNVSDWNEYFGLPVSGTPFTSVVVSGTTISFFGGGNMTLKSNLFLENEHILSVSDTSGMVTRIEYGAFGGCVNLSSIEFGGCTVITDVLTGSDYGAFQNCVELISVKIPLLEYAGDYAFQNCYSLTDLDLPSLTSAGMVRGGAFADSGLVNINFPSLLYAGDYCFLGCVGLISADFSKLIWAGTACFVGCIALTTSDFVSLLFAGSACFVGCTGFTFIDLSSCVLLGTTVTDNEVFGGFVGLEITLSVPSALMNCNDGDPDGDIIFLGNENEVTFIIDGELVNP